MYPTQPEQPASQPIPVKSGKGKRKLLYIIIATLVTAAVAGGLAWWYFQSQADAALEQDSAAVEITSESYNPGTITVKAGQEVTWTNADDEPRELAADAETLPDFGGGEALQRGDTYSYMFDQAGTYHYYDPVDPVKYSGTIIVE